MFAPAAAALEEAAALDAAALEAEAEALDAALEAALELPPEEQPTKAAAMAAVAPTPMKPLLVRFFMFSLSFPFPIWQIPVIEARCLTPVACKDAYKSVYYSVCYSKLK